MLDDDQFSNIFGLSLPLDETKIVLEKFKNKFRKEFIKKDISTHGLIWSNFKGAVNWVKLDEIKDFDPDPCYVYIEARKRSKLYTRNFLKFREYLLNRDDGRYPAIYVFDINMVECICDTGENGSLSPIVLMRVVAKD
ncbi:hypothetical protein [Spartinivicinus poritis]|uniref:Uncharacterized protein n=1 Tax=Spartinivicinus poritis TaxID=2994640 RepID=A0ABT5U5V1_9GAMM|nr:hypothetical protein [Spartinivicinus sp. A2-2]MDE1461741.1 hypothetical protein [Spartinivicinus sp. A2-2]